MKKSPMDNLREIIRQVLNEEDVEGLLAAGAPRDEYNAEAELIIQAIEHGQVKPEDADLKKLLRDIWQNMFGPFSEQELNKRNEALNRVAKQLAKVCSAGTR